MNKTSFYFIISFFCFLFWSGSGAEAFSQAPISPELIQDDPIVAALDKLYKLDLFEKGYAKISYPKNPKYHFAIDSIPHYDDMIYEARLAKLDALSPFDLGRSRGPVRHEIRRCFGFVERGADKDGHRAKIWRR